MIYEQRRYILIALDPVHIGTGGYRLGRVDLSIAREPGTNLPKIPGTSLSGAVRSYAAMQYGKPDCSGQGQAGDGRQEHCGDVTCPICYTFGYAKASGGFSGTVGLGDAHLLLFPVYSMNGPVWVSTNARLSEAGFSASGDVQTSDKVLASLTDWSLNTLNLGWLMFSVEKDLTVNRPGTWTANPEIWDSVKDRLVLVSDKLFSKIVNSNLEVRTSVSINPHTGAADEGALFTYEAIPRSAWLYFDVIKDDYRLDLDGPSPFPTVKKCKVEVKRRANGKIKERKYTDQAGDDFPNNKEWKCPLDVVHEGLDLVQYLGVGGMGTRGFGRMQQIGNWKVAGGDS